MFITVINFQTPEYWVVQESNILECYMPSSEFDGNEISELFTCFEGYLYQCS